MAIYDFRWNEWNLEKIAKHGVTVEDAEQVVRRAMRPYPQRIDDGKVLVRGQARSGAYLQVIYVPQENHEVFVIHARPLTENEKTRLRRRRR
jgi:uncharacterized DUF497 family protein